MFKSTSSKIQVSCENVKIYAIAFGIWEKDPEFRMVSAGILDFHCSDLARLEATVQPMDASTAVQSRQGDGAGLSQGGDKLNPRFYLHKIESQVFSDFLYQKDV